MSKASNFSKAITTMGFVFKPACYGGIIGGVLGIIGLIVLNSNGERFSDGVGFLFLLLGVFGGAILICFPIVVLVIWYLILHMVGQVFRAVRGEE